MHPAQILQTSPLERRLVYPIINLRHNNWQLGPQKLFCAVHNVDSGVTDTPGSEAFLGRMTHCCFKEIVSNNSTVQQYLELW